jgi:hypothetical protein
MKTTLRLTGRQHSALANHLYPGDGMEAVSIGICGRHRGVHAHTLTLQKLLHIPYEECHRTGTGVTWSTRRLEELLVQAIERDMAVVKFHSHPGGFDRFSEIDDRADADLFGSIHGWTDGHDPHASVIVLPDGRMLGRAIHVDGGFEPLNRIAVAGDDLKFFDEGGASLVPPAAFDRQVRLFGEATTALLRRLAIGVVGCSGTGGPTVEMLGRLGVGRIVLVDPDHVGLENLPRIPNATAADAEAKVPKVDVLARALRAMGLGTTAEAIPENIAESPRAVRALAGVDVLLGCVDSVEGRHVLNRIAAFYNLPYFDVGVKLLADGTGSVQEVCGAVHYLQPDGSSLLDRKVYTAEQFRAEATKRSDPKAYEELKRQKYIQGVIESRPAVVTVNTQLAAMMLNEVLARLHPYRLDSNREFAVVRISLAQMQTYCEPEDHTDARTFAKQVGRGDVRPLLDMPELSGVPT